LANEFGTLTKLRGAKYETLEKMSGVGPIIARSIIDFFLDKDNKKMVDNLLEVVSIEKTEVIKGGPLSGKSFVLTGTLESMSRDEAKEKIRALGGSIGESVSKETSYLIAGENTGSKYQKATELGVKIIAEKEFLSLL